MLCIWSILGFAVVLGVVQGQPKIHFLPSDVWPPGSGLEPAGDEDTMRNLPSFVRSCDKLCVVGNWAMYTKPDWGEGFVDTTLVYPVKSASLECLTGAKSILSKIYSVRPVGWNSTGEVAQMDLFYKAYFLGEVVEFTDPMYESESEDKDIRSIAFEKSFIEDESSFVAVCPRGSKTCSCYDNKVDVSIPDVKTLSTNPSKKLVDCVKKTTKTCTYGIVLRTGTAKCDGLID